LSPKTAIAAESGAGSILATFDQVLRCSTRGDTSRQIKAINEAPAFAVEDMRE
jgi:hypothetical protein